MKLKGKFWSGWYIALLIIAGIVFIITELPQGYSSDLSVIGKGKDAIILIHDSKSFPSVEFISRMNIIRDKYQEKAVFRIADIKDEEGKIFAQDKNVKPPSLILFAADGAELGTIDGKRSSEFILESITKFFQW